MANPQYRDPFVEGLALFNEGKFFECHEAWEISWQRADGEVRVFLQGLIQAAVAILHAERGNPRGAASVYAKAKAKLDALPENFMGIEVEEFRAALADFFGRVKMEREVPIRPQIRRCG
jgi:predicted metal-dependent hydrolase